MTSNVSKPSLLKAGIAASALLLASGLAFADNSSVTLTAGRSTTMLPDGQTVPMWGYTCGAPSSAVNPPVAPVNATCTAMNGLAQTGATWQPPLITVPSGNQLTITLFNTLSFAKPVPTSLVIVGQLGGGLGSQRGLMSAATKHPVTGTTWPGTLGGTDVAAGDAVFTPPSQPPRVRSLATEVPAGVDGVALTWNALRPGTYLIESGTEPSIQGAMGLYGVLVVTEADTTPTGSAPSAHQAYGTTFDQDVPLLFSEIDPVQNAEVDAVVNNSGFDELTVWSGVVGGCGDVTQPSSAHTCYPPAVNYSPRYYLINGVSFDRTNKAASSLAIAPNGGQGRVLLRLVNAGLRMHVPSVVGANLTLLAEDGNKLKGNARIQSEVFLAAGKTYDVTIPPKQTVSGTYDGATLPIFDRSLDLSTGNQRDGGMQAYLNVAGGATTGVGAGASPGATANPDTYSVIPGKTLTVGDPAKGVLANDVGIYGVAVVGAAPAGLTLNANGTFTYTGGAATSFGYCGNGATSGSACTTVTLQECTGTCLGDTPVAGNGTFTSNVASRAQIPPPGVLAFVANPSGNALTATASVGGCLKSINADGSFVATPSAPIATPTGTGTCTFQYNVVTSTGKSSADPGTITVNFGGGNGISFKVYDAPSLQPGKTPVEIADYRWVIEEDRTFWIDPGCQINTTGTRVDARGNACPKLPVESLGYNFHTAHMPVVAQGCVGTVSCEGGQTLGGQAAVCDLGNGACRTDGASLAPTMPSDVHLDPNKRYFISVLPGDGVNTTIGGAGGPDNSGKPFTIASACGPYDPADPRWKPGNLGDTQAGIPSALCGHAMGGAQIAPGQTTINIALQQTPLPTAQIAVFVFEDDNPLNGENDAGGGVDVIAPNEPGLGGFEVKLFDQAGGLGDATGQITYDMFNQPVSNALAGRVDPITGLDSCPITTRTDGLVGMIPTCPKYESDGKTPSPLAGQATIANLYPGLYEIVATPAADRIAAGEEWLQTNTLDGGKPHEAFIKPNEPGYFQEFGPGGFHVAIGFANPALINSKKAGYCGSAANAGAPCNATLNVQVTNNHMSRTPDQRTFSSETYDHYSFTQCYVSVGPADGEDFAFGKCSPDGKVSFTNMPTGTFKLTVFDQWNDIMLDGLVSTVTIDNTGTTKVFPVTQWRTNLFTRTFIDTNGDNVSQETEPGLALVNTNIRYRDGSIGFFNNTDLNGYAGFNEVFPFMNWLVVETTSTRFKPTGVHTVYDAGGPVDCSQQAGANGPCSTIAANIANTDVRVPLPADLRMPGAKYCDQADCDPATDQFTGKSTGTIFPPQPFGTSQGWQGLLGQNSFMEFAMKPFASGENGGISGQVIYASTRPFDDPALSLQLQWEPGVPNATINLYRKTVDESGNEHLVLFDTTQSASWDDWAQGFRRDKNGALVKSTTLGGYVPNMNCPGQDVGSPFFATLQDSKQWLDTPDANGDKKAIAAKAQFKCYDGWSVLNQIQPAPYDGYYRFPSIKTVDANGKPASTNCDKCAINPVDGTPMLPPGKYVVEIKLPDGYELVKEEDKNILLGDVYIAPVVQQFLGFGNVFIMPDQAAVASAYNPHNPGALNNTTNLGATPRHEGDTGSIESFWPCVGAERIVPDLNSLYPGAGQAAPFAGAKRRLCDRKEVLLEDQASVLAKFFIFSSTHVAGHFAGTITNDFASEFDPFSPQFGEKFGPPNLPVGMRDFTGNEVARVYSDQWGIYNGLFFSSYGVNPPNPTGYVPQMAIACMNDPGPIVDTRVTIPDPANPNGPAIANPTLGQPITDPAYNPAYSNFCYETPFMPGFTAYMDTPVIPTQAFADGYNLPDSEYPNNTPAVRAVNGDGVGPWVAAAGATKVVSTVTVGSGGTGYSSAPTVAFNNTGTGGSGATATAILGPSPVTGLTLTQRGAGYTSVPSVVFSGTGTGAAATAFLGVGSVTITNSGRGSYPSATPTVSFDPPVCAPLGTATCAQATGTVTMTTQGFGGTAASRRRVASVNITNPGAGYTTTPVVKFSTGPAAATASLGVSALTLDGGGDGYVGAPTVAFAGGGGTGAAATARVSAPVASVAVTYGGSGYNTAPTVSFSGGGGSGASATAIIAPSGHLTIVALGDKVVQNPAFSGPNATTAPYNQKTITRHYGFGGTAGTVALVGSDGVARPLAGPVTWDDSTITGTVPTGLPNCTVPQRNQPAAQCGQLVITRADGKQSIDAITVTIGGSLPWRVSPQGVTAPQGKSVKDYGAAFGRMGPSPVQTALDSADPGDLILVGPGTYRENLIMWKPVRLQGAGAASVTINADAHPAGKMDQWRRQVDCVFGLSIEGVPNLNDTAYDKSGTYSCPAAMHQRVDRIPFEAIVGWDASGNGNLAQVLQEPTLMGAYEGAGITVLGRGVRVPNGNTDFWGVNATGGAGAFTDGSVYLSGGNSDCTSRPTAVDGRDYGTSNYFCNPSRIDGVSIVNSSQGGGGLFIHGWGHNLEVANTRISGNHGTLAGAINLGNGETPDAFINDGVECNVTPVVMACPPVNWNGYTPVRNAVIPFQFNTKVRIHHNMLYNNASIGDALFSGTPAGAGAITVSAGADGYQIDHNWIAGNLSTGDGGGLQHLGLSFQGKINNNYVLFNQSTNPTLPTNGGGITVMGANLDRQLNGQECGSTTDQDCPPGLGEGTGFGNVIDANLILGNSSESGSGGGLRIQQLNGSEVGAFAGTPNQWYDLTVTNNVIANNVAGWDGGGVSIQDALKVTFVNNTVVSNDTTASAGVLFKTLGAINAATPPPGCTPKTDPTLPQDPSCTRQDAPHGPQPSGLVAAAHTPNLIEALFGLQITCPTSVADGSYPYSAASNGDCTKLSKPKLVNDLFWQNRAFAVNVVDTNGNPVPDQGTTTPTGTGLQSQQNLVAMTPALNQTATGMCPAGANYWDIGLRTDDLVTGQIPAGTKLVLVNSVLTGDPQNVITPSATNVVPGAGGAAPVIAPVCNGARMPPEHCTSATAGIDATNPSCKGFNAPPGASETTGLAQVFVFNGIKPTATVDEGHNWLNLSYGPLTLSRPGVATTTAPELMIASGDAGSTGGAYALPTTSVAVNAGTNTGVPATTAKDFFGHARGGANGAYDIGAIECQGALGAACTGAGGGGGGGTTVPTLAVLDNFNRATTTNLNTGAPAGTSWSQATLLGAGSIAVFDTTTGNVGTGVAQDLLVAGSAFWNGSSAGPVFGAKQAAAFTFAGTPLNNSALVLKATGGTTTAPASFVRVLYTTAAGGTITIQTTTNSGGTYTTAAGGALTGFGNFASGDVLTAMVDSAGVVTVWKTHLGTTTTVGTRTLAAVTAWTTGGGRIGMQLPGGAARIDNFAGGTVP